MFGNSEFKIIFLINAENFVLRNDVKEIFSTKKRIT